MAWKLEKAPATRVGEIVLGEVAEESLDSVSEHGDKRTMDRSLYCRHCAQALQESAIVSKFWLESRR
jgi:hypothetical protein